MEDSKKLLVDYKEGETYMGETITKLYSVQSEYMIFEGTNTGDIIVATDNPELRKRCSEISPLVSVITGYLSTIRDKQKYADQIGLAYSEAIEGNIESAKKICNDSIENIELLKSNIGRFYYLLSCLTVVIIALLLSYLLKKYKFIPEIIPQFYIMTYASIGGFLAVAKDIKKIHVSASDFGWFQIFYGATRILISMFSGLIIYVLIKSELIFPDLNKQENIFVICILAVVAGFSETFLPNLLKKIENE